MKIFRPARRTNSEHAIRPTDRDGSLKSMNPAALKPADLKPAGHYLGDNKEHLPFKKIVERDHRMYMNLKNIFMILKIF